MFNNIKLHPDTEAAFGNAVCFDGMSHRNRQMLEEIRRLGIDADTMDFIDGTALKNKAAMRILVSYYNDLDLYYKELVLNMVSLTVCPELALLAYRDYLTFDDETKLAFGQFDKLFSKVKETSPYYKDIRTLLESPENFYVLQGLTKSAAKREPAYLAPILQSYEQGLLLPFVLRAYAEFAPSPELVSRIKRFTLITDAEWRELCRAQAYTLPDFVKFKLMSYIDADYVRQDAKSALRKLMKKQIN